MKTTSQSETSFSSTLLNWATYHISRTMAAIKPVHLASHIADSAAASGNPSGV